MAGAANGGVVVLRTESPVETGVRVEPVTMGLTKNACPTGAADKNRGAKSLVAETGRIGEVEDTIGSGFDIFACGSPDGAGFGEGSGAAGSDSIPGAGRWNCGP